MICYTIKISFKNSINVFLIEILSFVQFNKYNFDIYKGFCEKNGHNLPDFAKTKPKIAKFLQHFLTNNQNIKGILKCSTFIYGL